MYKKLLCISVLSGMLLLTSCGTTQQSLNNSDTTTIGSTSEYTELSWSKLPNSMNDSLEVDNSSVCLMGYLSSYITQDKSTAYLYNSHVDLSAKEFYEIEDTMGLKLASLDLSNIIKYENQDKYNKENLSAISLNDGQQFVKVYGVILREDSIDMYSNPYKWKIKVSSIEIAEELPDALREYEKFASSDEFEAFSSCVNYAGNYLYNQTLDEESRTEITDTMEYDIDETLKGIENNYPILWKETQMTLSEIKTIVENVDNNTIGSSDDYNRLVELYSDLINTINNMGILT